MINNWAVEDHGPDRIGDFGYILMMAKLTTVGGQHGQLHAPGTMLTLVLAQQTFRLRCDAAGWLLLQQ